MCRRSCVKTESGIVDSRTSKIQWMTTNYGGKCRGCQNCFGSLLLDPWITQSTISSIRRGRTRSFTMFGGLCVHGHVSTASSANADALGLRPILLRPIALGPVPLGPSSTQANFSTWVSNSFMPTFGGCLWFSFVRSLVVQPQSGD